MRFFARGLVRNFLIPCLFANKFVIEKRKKIILVRMHLILLHFLEVKYFWLNGLISSL